jgi:hypothetical protein
VSNQAGSRRKQRGGIVLPLSGYELAMSQSQRSRGLARIGHEVSEEACANAVVVEDVRGAEVRWEFKSLYDISIRREHAYLRLRKCFPQGRAISSEDEKTLIV